MNNKITTKKYLHGGYSVSTSTENIYNSNTKKYDKYVKKIVEGNSSDKKTIEYYKNGNPIGEIEYNNRFEDTKKKSNGTLNKIGKYVLRKIQ